MTTRRQTRGGGSSSGGVDVIRLVLLLVFIGIPLVELALLIQIGRSVGIWPTVALVVLTGALGAALARRQGLGVLRHMREELRAGRLPAGALVDGIVILIAAALLITPGILTDAAGFLCLVPAFRRVLKGAVRRRLERAVREHRWRVSVRLEP